MSRDRGPTILLVEDDRDEEILLKRAIAKSTCPCDVVVAHTTDEALDLLFCPGEGSIPFMPDVIVTDLRVAPIGGAELVSVLREQPNTRLIPIVVLTGAASAAQIDELYLRGVNSFLEKPTDFAEFGDLIQRLANYWGGLNRAPAVNGAF